MQNKKDLRVIKTEKVLFDALIELMTDKPFESIKVSDICSKALINRSTFYSHYNDKYELLVGYINNLEESLINKLGTLNKEINNKDYFVEIIKLILDHFDEKRDTYYKVLLNNRNSIFIDIVSNVISTDINKKINQDINSKNDNIPLDIKSTFYLGAVSSVIIKWINNDKKYTKEEIVTYLDNLIPYNI